MSQPIRTGAGLIGQTGGQPGGSMKTLTYPPAKRSLTLRQRLAVALVLALPLVVSLIGWAILIYLAGIAFRFGFGGG